LRLFTGQFVSS